MALPTDDDYAHMSEYVLQRLSLYALRNSQKVYPQIYSWVDVFIRPATFSDYVFDEAFNDSAIMVTLGWNPLAKNVLRCNQRGPDRDLRYGDNPISFRSGNVTDTAFEPSCFLRQDIIHDTNSEPDIPLFGWSEQDSSFYVEQNGLLAWMQDPILRSDKRFTTRLNTIPTGADTFIGKFQNGALAYTATQNSYYCDEFFMDYKNGGCVQSTWDKFLGITLLGESIPLLVKQACNRDAGTVRDLGLVPEAVDPILLSAEEWRQNVKPDFILANPLVTLSSLGLSIDLFNRGRASWVNGELIETVLLYKWPGYQRPQLHKLSNATQRVQHYPNLHQNVLPIMDGEDQDIVYKIAQLITAVLLAIPALVVAIIESLDDPYFWGIITYGILENMLMKYAKDFLVEQLPKLIIESVGKSVSERIFRQGVYKVVEEGTKSLALKMSKKFAMCLAKTSSGVFKVLDIVEWIGLALDLLMMIWDPLGMNNQFDSSVFDEMSKSAIAQRGYDQKALVDPLTMMVVLTYVPEVEEGEVEEGEVVEIQETEVEPKLETNLAAKLETNLGTNLAPTRVQHFQTNLAAKLETNLAAKLEPTRVQHFQTNKTKWASLGKREHQTKQSTVLTDAVDIENFMMNSCSHYLANRTSNSLGQRFDWESDQMTWDETNVVELLGLTGIAGGIVLPEEVEALVRNNAKRNYTLLVLERAMLCLTPLLLFGAFGLFIGILLVFFILFYLYLKLVPFNKFEMVDQVYNFIKRLGL